MMQVAEFQSWDELHSLRDLWAEHAAQTPRPSFTHSLEWIEAWWNAYHKPAWKLKVLVSQVAGRIIGIVPLIIQPISTGMGSANSLMYPTEDWTPWIGPIGKSPAATMFAAMKSLSESPRDWELIDLRGATPGLDAERTMNTFRMCHMQAVERPFHTLRIIDRTANDGSHRLEWMRKFRAAEQQLSSDAGYCVHGFPAPSQPRHDLLSAWSDCESLWEGRRAEERQFLRTGFTAAANAGAARLWLLRSSTQIVGYLAGVETGGHLELFDAGMHPTIAEFGFDRLLGQILHCPESAAMHTIWFAPRLQHLADSWANQLVPTSRWTHFAPLALRSQFLRWNHWRKQVWAKPVAQAAT